MVFIGVDAHKSTSQITVMDESSNVLKRQRVPSSPAGFQQGLSGFDHPMKAVLEASYCWGPMFDWLNELADEVVLAHPSKVRAIAEARIKTDKIDSETLAHLLRADLIPLKESRPGRRHLHFIMSVPELTPSAQSAYGP